MKKVWNFLRSMTFGMVVLGLIVVCSLAGSLIAQGNDPAWYVQTYPGWHGPLLALGLDHIFTSWYFVALLVLLCLNLTLCSLVRVVRVGRAARGAVARAAGQTLQVPLTEAGMEELTAYLELRRFRRADLNGVRVYHRGGLGWYGSFLTHLAILLTVLFGAAAIYLPQVSDQTCMPGQSLALEGGASVYVDSFHIEDNRGKLDYASVIDLTLPDGRSSGLCEIRVNRPLSFGSYKIYQQTYGTAGSIAVRNTATGGEDTFTLDTMSFLSLDGVNGLWYEALYPGYVRDEAGNFTLITQTSGAYPDPVYQVLLVSDGVHTPVLAFPGESVTVGGVEFTFQDPVEYPGLRIKRTPAAVNALLCAVFVLMLAGLWCCFFHVPVLVTVFPEGYAVGGPKPQGTVLELERLLGDKIRRDTPC